NRIILFGARTGLDGIGGVSVLASETFEEDEHGAPVKPRKLPSVQVGDPFAEKVLIECCLDLYRDKLVVGIQDLGGAGLACATSELAAAGDGGMHIVLDNVPLRAEGMSAAEILSSESQERMCAVVAPENVDAFMEVCRRWDVLATDIGEVTDGDHLTIEFRGETVVDVPPRTVAHDGPVYERPLERPADQDALQADTARALARPSTGDELRRTLLDMVSSPALCSRKFITEQYDRYVRGNTVLAENADGGVLRIDEESGRGIALSTDASGRYTRLDPYTGARLALAEAYRNVAVTGATPVAVTNCLNFGSPEDPGVMWQFREAVHGLADGCAELGIPVTGGNVSFYNQTGSTPILPTPVVGVLGVIDDVARRTPTAFGDTPGESVYLLGETREELDGSIWAQVAHGHLGGMPPTVDLAWEATLARILTTCSKDGLITGAHDLSEGGLAQALVESLLAGECGLRVVLPEDADPFVWLFSESSGRVIVSVPRGEEIRFQQMLTAQAIPHTRVGVTDPDSGTFEVQGRFTLTTDELRAAHEGTLPSLFGVDPV
uniref:phosphoribosylformylglycinamidine synthase subunit PurL n=1 Tax=Dietzia sp. UBA5065 TaxID=1946422 RepID=UPI0025BB89B7